MGALDEFGAVGGWEETEINWAFKFLLFLDWFFFFNLDVFLGLQATGVGSHAVSGDEIVFAVGWALNGEGTAADAHVVFGAV